MSDKYVVLAVRTALLSEEPLADDNHELYFVLNAEGSSPTAPASEARRPVLRCEGLVEAQNLAQVLNAAQAVGIQL